MLGTGVNTKTGTKHPIRPVQTSSAVTMQHDFCTHLVGNGEIFATTAMRDEWRTLFLEQGTEELQPERFAGVSRILKFSAELDQKIKDLKKHPDLEKREDFLRQCNTLRKLHRHSRIKRLLRALHTSGS